MRDRTRNQQRLDKRAYDRRIEGGMVKAPRSRAERRALARQIVKTQPDVLESVRNSTVETTGFRMAKGEAKQQATRLIAGVLRMQEAHEPLVENDHTVKTREVAEGVAITESGLIVPSEHGLLVP
jgi:hypothetical protein